MSVREQAQESYKKAMDRRQAALARLKADEEAQSKLSAEEREAIRARNSEIASAVKKDNPVNTAPVLGGTGMFGEGGKVIRVSPEPGGLKRAKDTKRQEDPEGDADGVRSETGQGSVLREHQQGKDQRDGDEHRGEAEAQAAGARGEELWVSRRYEAESKEALAEIIPADAKAVTYKKLWTAWALVRKE